MVPTRILVRLLALAAGVAAMAALLRRRQTARKMLRGPEITELLAGRHQQVRALIGRYQSTQDRQERRAIFADLRRLLSVHEAMEEQVVHPVVRRVVPGGHQIVVRVLEQEQEGKELLATIERSQSDGEIDEALVAKLFEGVEVHAQTEETEVFPQLRLHVDHDERSRMGALAERAERMAPTHPHPKAPSTPPANVLVGVPAAAVDRARDAMARTQA
jgi:hemerythrin superfamily protein